MNKLIIAIIAVFLFASHAHGKTYTVRTKNNALRKSCTFFSPVTMSLQFGNVLELVDDKGDWLIVKSRGVEGCIHSRAVSAKKFSYGALGGFGQSSTLVDEVSLAGKGFTAEIERSFKAQNPGAQFYHVDAIESIRVSDAELLEFIKSGELNSQ